MHTHEYNTMPIIYDKHYVDSYNSLTNFKKKTYNNLKILNLLGKKKKKMGKS